MLREIKKMKRKPESSDNQDLKSITPNESDDDHFIYPPAKTISFEILSENDDSDTKTIRHKTYKTRNSPSRKPSDTATICCRKMENHPPHTCDRCKKPCPNTNQTAQSSHDLACHSSECLLNRLRSPTKSASNSRLLGTSSGPAEPPASCFDCLLRLLRWLTMLLFISAVLLLCVQFLNWWFLPLSGCKKQCGEEKWWEPIFLQRKPCHPELVDTCKAVKKPKRGKCVGWGRIFIKQCSDVKFE